MTKRQLIAELHRRHVFRVAAAYAVAGWLLIQIAATVFPFFELPAWSVRLIVLLMLGGFPVALVLAWVFDATRQGIERTSVAAGESPHRSRRTGILIGLVGVLIAGATGTAYWFWSRVDLSEDPGSAPSASIDVHPSGDTPAVDPKSVAVLPFENLSADKENQYFAEGIHDEILTRLAKIGALKVISRTSTQHYRSQPENLGDVARQLGVANILEGSVQQVGEQVLINVQLIDARSDAHIWAESYARKLDDIFGVEREVAQAVADSLKATLTSAELRAVDAGTTTNPAAFDAYLRGLALDTRLVSQSPDTVREVEATYAHAVELDPGFAQAWGRLGMTRCMIYFQGIDRTPAFLASAKSAADTALKLQPDLGEGWLALGYYRYWGQRDLDGALNAFEQARQHLPNNADAVAAIGFIERRQGKWQDSIASLQRAAQLDPRTVDWYAQKALSYSMLRQFDQAHADLDRALEIAPGAHDLLAEQAGMWQAQGNLEAAGKLLDTLPLEPSAPSVFAAKLQQLIYQRRYQKAIDALEAALAAPDPALGQIILDYQADLAAIQHWAGHADSARAAAARLLELLRKTSTSEADNALLAPLLAEAYTGLGDQAAALREAQRAIALSAGDAIARPSAQVNLARIQVRFGQIDAALAELQQLVEVPGALMPGDLRLDPEWDPLRESPRFQAVLKEADRPIALP